MSKTNLNEFMSITRDRRMLYDNDKTPIINYYLSRKLRKETINEIIDRFDDDYIKTKILSVYETNHDNIEELSRIEDLTKDEIINLLNMISSEIGRKGGDLSTPKGIIDLSLSILSVKGDDVLLDIGSGYGTTLLSGSQYTNNLVGVEINRDNVLVSKLLTDLFNINANIKLSDALINDNNQFKANKVFVNTPLGLRMSSDRLDNILREKFKNSKYKNLVKAYDLSWLFALDILENTVYEKFVMVVAGGSLFNVRESEIRKNLILEGKIESVIALPGSLLYGTTIPVYLIVFSHNNKTIRMVDAQELYYEDKFMNVITKVQIDEIVNSLHNDSKISNTVTIEELEKEEFSLMPHLYGAQEFEFKSYIELGKVIKSINRGSMINKSDLEKLTSDVPTDNQYLMLQNFQDGFIEGQLPYLKEIDKKLEKFTIKNGSLIVSRISPFKIGIIDNLKTNVIANGNLYVIEVDEKVINKDYLAAYLQSQTGMNEMERYIKGAAMKTISIPDLQKVRIPDFSLEKQLSIGEEFKMLNLELKTVKQRHRDILKEKLNIIKGGIWCL